MGGGGGRARLRAAAVAAAVALLIPGAARALGSDFDHPGSANTAQQFTPPPAPTNPQRQDKPNDPKYDQAEPDGNTPHSTNFYDERFDLFGFPSALTPSANYVDGPNMGKGRQVAGFNAAGAWKLTRGRPDVTIAILDTGIRWDSGSLRRRIHLNTGELPLPQGSSVYDKNGDGQINVDDYATDTRVPHSGPITAEDLIHAFGHCQLGANHAIVSCSGSGSFDNDGNGYANDIAGWDFFDNDNNPVDSSSYFAAHNHGTGRASDAAEEGNDGDGSIGVCPRCQIMPLRIWDTFVSDANNFGQAVIYAADNGVKVIEGANGSLYHSAFAEQASQYAYDHGVVQTFSGDDLNTGNHNYPANYGHAMLIEGTVPDTVGLGQACPSSAGPLCNIFTAGGVSVGTNVPPGTFFRGANTTQFGGKSSISMEGPTGSVNTGKASGAAGMVVSAALENGITLRPDETREILEQTAEDVTQGNTGGTGTPDPAQPGWDEHFGWGRVDLGAAVSTAADAAKIPDIAAIDSPDWYAPLTGATLNVTGLADAPRDNHQFHYKVEWGPGLAPTTWNPVPGTDVNATGPVTNLGSINLATVRAAMSTFNVPLDPAGPVFSPTTPNPFQQQFTVRLTVTGPGRLPGVDRRVFTAVPDDEGLRPGYPKRLGTGGEAPVRYADLNGDNVQELIVPGEDGVVHAYEPGGSELPGWPVKTQLQGTAVNHTTAPGVAALVAAGAPPREPPRGAAVADLDGDGKPEVIDTAGTHLYVWEGDGSLRAGFPVESDLANCGPAFERQTDRHLKCGFLASPTVADLEGTGRRADIVVAALDGHLYGFKANGDPVPHFPVRLVDPAQVTQGTEVLAESINQVAVGDLNGDGVDDVVAGTNETYGATNSGDVSFAGLLGGQGQSTRVYAVNGKTGGFLPGWPITISGLIQDTLPLIGPGNDPTIMNVGGVTKVLASATSGSLATYDVNGASDQTMRQEDSSKGNAVDKSPALNLFESAVVGKLSAATPDPSVVKYEISLAAAADLLLVGQNFPYNHLIGAWDSSTGEALPSYPTITDDFQFLSSSTIAKVDPASPANQILAGTGLGLLHAYDGVTAQDAPGFPKTTGGWLFSPAALSDDGRMAGITREGYLFEWTSTADKCQTEWPTFRHDPQNSGNYDRDGTAPAAPGDLSLTAVAGGKYKVAFKSPGDDGFCQTADKYVANVDGQAVDLGAPIAGGAAFSKDVTLPAGALLTIQAVDEAKNVGQPASVAIPASSPAGTSGGNPETPPGGGGPTGGGKTPDVTPPAGVCKAGAKVPRSSISRRHLVATRRRIALSGRSIEVDCLTGKLTTGRVSRVLVSVARAQGGRCRYLRRSGRLGASRSCSRPLYLRARISSKRGARNKTLWSLRLPVRLPRGHYVATVRGIDATGRRETISRPTNTKAFRIR